MNETIQIDSALMFDPGQLTIVSGEVMVIVKLMVVLGLLVYLFFSFLVIRQVEMMISSISEALPLPVKSVAWAHLLMVIAVLGFALMV